MDDKQRILIGSPVYQKPDILHHFLVSLKRLSNRNIEFSYIFIDDNVIAESTNALKGFERSTDRVTLIHSEKQDDYICDDVGHQWKEELVWKVAEFKNRMIEVAKQLQYDFLFLIDSDILLHPDTITRLVSCKKDIISEIFWTKWQPGSEPQPQVWLLDEYTQWKQKRGESISNEEIQRRYSEFINQMKIPGVYQVGGLGACTLISKKAIQSGVDFNPISNLSFWGEDRHFCVRASVLGFSLFVDTTFPAFHIYREAELEKGKEFLHKTNACKSGRDTKQIYISRRNRPSITLSMVMKNESERYIKRVLNEHLHYIDQAVLIDDGSTDNTVEICLETLREIPVKLIKNEVSKFSNEIDLRKQQRKETTKINPEWILNLDADEIFESRFRNEIHSLLEGAKNDVFCFRLYDFWNETHYREDQYWNAHVTYRPFLMRYRKDTTYTWRETALHCGRFPKNIFTLSNEISDLRVKHLGWMRLKDRIEKLHRYLELDAKGLYGSLEQYKSILDENPTLVKWEE